MALNCRYTAKQGEERVQLFSGGSKQPQLAPVTRVDVSESQLPDIETQESLRQLEHKDQRIDAELQQARGLGATNMLSRHHPLPNPLSSHTHTLPLLTLHPLPGRVHTRPCTRGRQKDTSDRRRDADVGATQLPPPPRRCPRA